MSHPFLFSCLNPGHPSLFVLGCQSPVRARRRGLGFRVFFSSWQVLFKERVEVVWASRVLVLLMFRVFVLKFIPLILWWGWKDVEKVATGFLFFGRVVIFQMGGDAFYVVKFFFTWIFEGFPCLFVQLWGRHPAHQAVVAEPLGLHPKRFCGFKEPSGSGCVKKVRALHPSGCFDCVSGSEAWRPGGGWAALANANSRKKVWRARFPRFYSLSTGRARPETHTPRQGSLPLRNTAYTVSPMVVPSHSSWSADNHRNNGRRTRWKCSSGAQRFVRAGALLRRTAPLQDHSSAGQSSKGPSSPRYLPLPDWLALERLPLDRSSTGPPKISRIFSSPTANFVLSSFCGSFRGLVAAVQGHGPPKARVRASLGSFCARPAHQQKKPGSSTTGAPLRASTFPDLGPPFGQPPLGLPPVGLPHFSFMCFVLFVMFLFLFDFLLYNVSHGGQNDYQINSWKQFNLQSHKQKNSGKSKMLSGLVMVILKIRNYSKVW